jgi:hypothetical protein
MSADEPRRPVSSTRAIPGWASSLEKRKGPLIAQSECRVSAQSLRIITGTLNGNFHTIEAISVINGSIECQREAVVFFRTKVNVSGPGSDRKDATPFQFGQSGALSTYRAMGSRVIEGFEHRHDSDVGTPAFNAQGALPDCRQEPRWGESLRHMTLQA